MCCSMFGSYTIGQLATKDVNQTGLANNLRARLPRLVRLVATALLTFKPLPKGDTSPQGNQQLLLPYLDHVRVYFLFSSLLVVGNCCSVSFFDFPLYTM
jgi:hypothetical protein